MIVFIYLGEEKQNDLEMIGRWVEEARDMSVLVVGDWNARLGKERRMDWQERE